MNHLQSLCGQFVLAMGLISTGMTRREPYGFRDENEFQPNFALWALDPEFEPEVPPPGLDGWLYDSAFCGDRRGLYDFLQAHITHADAWSPPSPCISSCEP
jgi:hypothetical protein